MGFEAWLTVAVIGLCFGLLASNRVSPDVALMAGLTVLLLAGVLSPQEALAGMANEGMVAVGALYIVVSGLRETGAITWIVHHILGRPGSVSNAQLRLMTPVTVMSAFLNNTPVVAMMIPAVNDWAKRHGLSVSKLMLPLSYAAIAGGTCTLIGTSTNLVVNGLLLNHTDLPSLGLFDIAWVGVPTVFLVLAAIMVLGRWLLPDRQPAIGRFTDARGYTVEMMVEANSPLAGKTIEEAGLRQLPGLYLVEIDRQGEVLPAVSPQARLCAHDRLVFAGIVESVVDLQKIRGLKPATDQVFKLDVPRQQRCLIEAVVSDSCPLAGMSIREGRFRTQYDAAVIAASRNGEQIKKKIGDIVLRPGDTLLLEAHPSFVTRLRNSRDFYLISRLEDSSPPRHERALIALGIMTALVLTVALGWLSMLKAAMLAAGLMIVTKCTTGRIARGAVDWQVLIVIAASLGIGNAMQSTGVARIIADDLLALAGGNPLVALALIFTATSVFTALVTNNTAAILMFPIALSASNTLDVSLMPFVITIMMAASASFATPIGYQTNLMVFGPGGYHFSDYLKLGVPITVLVGILVVTIVPRAWPF